MDRLSDQCGRLGEHGAEIDRTGHHEYGEDPERKAEIADPVDDESLHGRRVGLRLVVPEADQQIAREADTLPAEEQLYQIVRRHQHQHGEGEQRQIAEKARPVRILGHIADGIEMDEGRNRGHHHQHHRRQGIDPQRPIDLEIARDDERHNLLMDLLVAKSHPREGDPRQQHGDEEERRGDQFGGARAGRGGLVVFRFVMGTMERSRATLRGRRTVTMILRAGPRRPAREPRVRADERDDPGQDGAQQRQKDDRLVHRRFQPFIRLTSSTAIEPRLR